MAEAAVEFVLEQLSTLIREEHTLLGGIRKEAKSMKDALGRLRAALRVADEMEEFDPQFEEWVKKVREIVYDTEDVLDEFMHRFGDGQTSGGFYTKMKKIYTSVKNLRARRRLALELKEIKDIVNKEYSQYQPLFPTSSTATAHNHNKQVHDGREDALFQKESDLVGIQYSKQYLLNLLLGAANDDDLRVHSVVGMGGLGKTTLVKKAYDDAQVINHFQHHRVWVTVSETYKVEKLLKDAIKQLVEQSNQVYVPQDFQDMSSVSLKKYLIDILWGKKYMIVLDDVWSCDVWSAIKYGFPRESVGSRIVITTRNSQVAVHASSETQGKVYSLEPLSLEDSWTLFCRKTFFGGSCPQHLVEISENLLRICDGLPLAIVVIAGVLATKRGSIEEWERFQRSLNIQLESNGVMKNMTNILSLSYYDLPYHLKHCFLYLSIFPEDVIIEKMPVIRLWVAEGFVKENSQQVKEEVAEGYLDELLHRNLIQMVDKTDDGRMNSFRVHDILREIILSKSKDQNFATVATGQNTTEPSHKFRRLAIHKFDDHILKSNSSIMHLRSLHLFVPLSSSTASSLLSKLFTARYIPLKVLDLRGAELGEIIPEEVFNLFQLKYLSLRNTKLRSVPKSIGRLQNLETLDLKNTYVIELPAEILKLCKLRHLLVYRYLDPWTNCWISLQSFNSPFKIGKLLCLQKLCFIQANNTPGGGGIKIVCEIGKLTQLTRLGVAKLRQEDGNELCVSLKKLTNLCSLSLTSASEDEILDIQHAAIPLRLQRLYLGGRLQRVPHWLPSLVGLTYIVLECSRLPQSPLPFLQDLPMLQNIILIKAYQGEELLFKANKFPKLKFLRIRKFEALKCIEMEEGSLHHLEYFELIECKLLEQVPLGIQHLFNLKAIYFGDMADKFSSTLEPNGENYANISPTFHKFIMTERGVFLIRGK